MGNGNFSKPIWLKIISPAGIIFDSSQDAEIVISSIVAKGVIPSKGSYDSLKGEAVYDFEILPDHSPFVAKVSAKSTIRVTGKPRQLAYETEFGGVVTVSYSENHTLATFTMQDVKLPSVQNK